MLFEVKSSEHGISANITESPNPKYKYRLLRVDDDSGKTIAVTFGDNFERFVILANEFVKGEL